MLSSSPTQATRQNLPRAFKERFGVDLEYLGGRSAKLVTRVENERAAGMYTLDVHLGGGDTVVGMYQNGWLAPVRPQLGAPRCSIRPSGAAAACRSSIPTTATCSS